MGDVSTALSERYMMGEACSQGEYNEVVVEHVVKPCGHTSCCPCETRTLTAVVWYYKHSDGSVYTDCLSERAWDSEASFTEWLDTQAGFEYAVSISRQINDSEE